MCQTQLRPRKSSLGGLTAWPMQKLSPRPKRARGSNLANWLAAGYFGVFTLTAYAGAQQEETLSSAFQLVLHQALENAPPPNPDHLSDKALREKYRTWFFEINPRLERYLNARHQSFEELNGADLRSIFLQTVWYESIRARLDPSLVLGVIEVESGFNKFAISSAGALGYMQVMPFWMSKALVTNGAIDQTTGQTKLQPSTRLLHLQTNVRFGCTILRHYMDIEGNSLLRALGRYNGNIRDDAYAQAVLRARSHWIAEDLRLRD